MSTYQPGIPTGLVNLDVDYQNIQNNFQQLDTSFGKDHVTFSSQTAQNGYHTSIHLNPISTTVTNPPNNQPVVTPVATAGYGQLFSASIDDGINTDTALYFLTGGNRLIQLTRNFAPVASASGYTFLPGGLVMQWGLATVTGSLSISYAIPLSAPAFSIQLTQFNSGVSSIVEFLQVFATSSTAFTLRVIDSNGTVSGSPRTIYWTAIGK